MKNHQTEDLKKSKSKEITVDDVIAHPELHIKYLEQQTMKAVNGGSKILNIYTGLREADQRCPQCCLNRVMIGMSLKCTICDR